MAGGREFDGVAVFGAEIGNIAALAARGELVRAVPTCPGMDLRELLRHLGSVYGCVLQGLRSDRIPQQWQRRPPCGLDLRRWFTGRARELHRELVARLAGAECAAWWPRHHEGTFWRPREQTVGFWRRRMAHETTIHRVDVERAYGERPLVEDEVALDGVDEVLDVIVRGHFDEALAPAGGEPTVCVNSRGHNRAWYLRVSERGAWPVGPNAPAAVVCGDPRSLYLWLWGRVADAAVTVEGDRAAAAALRRALVRATQ